MSTRPVLTHPVVVMDVSDLVRSAAFWGQLLGVTPGEPRSNGDYLTVGPMASGTTLVLQRVAENHRAKNRVHLDFTVADVESAVDLIVELGGLRLPKQFTGNGETMADPDGNEFCIAAYTRDSSGERTSSPEPVSEVTIETASDHPRELQTADALRELLATCDLSGLQWTSRVVVENWVIPHSHPVLTLNTRVQGDQLLAAYLHEQMHWWTAQHPGFGSAISDTRREWPSVPDEGGAGDEHSTRLHLIVCHLERRAMERVVGRSRTTAVLRDQIHGQVYPWVYSEIEIRQQVLDQVCTSRDLWPDRITPT